MSGVHVLCVCMPMCGYMYGTYVHADIQDVCVCRPEVGVRCLLQLLTIFIESRSSLKARAFRFG